MQLKDIGERKIIDILAEIFDISMLDDCATIPFQDSFLLITTDMVNERTHFPKGTKPYHMGWFSVAVNLSDIASKGGKPIGITLSIGFPRYKDINFIKEFANGAKECASQFDVPIIGGDTKEMDSITICGTAFGIIKQKEFMPRYGMREGDVVCVTGELGKAGYALSAIGKGKGAIDEILLIKPRVKEGISIASLQVVTSSMDISDGLASSLHQMSKLNNKGFLIHAEKIPIAEGAKEEHALYHGGDYELLLTIPKDDIKIAQERLKSMGCILTEIGEVIEEKKVVMVKNGEEETIENRGYEHFR